MLWLLRLRRLFVATRREALILWFALRDPATPRGIKLASVLMLLYLVSTATLANLGYDHNLYNYGGVPAAWTHVGEWQARNNVVLGGNTVFFYAVAPGERERLADSLERFAAEHPPDAR